MAKKEVYKLLYSFEAPDIFKLEELGVETTSLFPKDEVVIGSKYKKDYVLVNDRFRIPIEYVEKTKDFPYLRKNSKFNESISRIKEQAVKLSEKDSEKLDSLGNRVSDVVEGKTKARFDKNAKIYKNGALLGLGVGIVSALYFKKNIWFLGIVGTALGGYIAHNINESKKGNNVVN
jgi:hypothetical protein